MVLLLKAPSGPKDSRRKRKEAESRRQAPEASPAREPPFFPACCLLSSLPASVWLDAGGLGAQPPGMVIERGGGLTAPHNLFQATPYGACASLTGREAGLRGNTARDRGPEHSGPLGYSCGA